jgi:hypothetical protein
LENAMACEELSILRSCLGVFVGAMESFEDVDIDDLFIFDLFGYKVFQQKLNKKYIFV